MFVNIVITRSRIMKPQLITVVGITGAGKSVVGKLIAKNRGFTFVDKDTVATELTEVILENLSPLKDKHERESSFYLEVVRPLAYESMLHIALENIELGNSVVVAAAFDEEIKNADFLEENEYMEAIRKLANIKVVHVHVDHSTLLKRLIARNEQRDSWKLANWDSYVKEVGSAKVQWNSALYKLLTFDNSDALPILYEIKTNNLLHEL